MSIITAENLRGGASWSWRLKRHQRLRVVDTDGRASVAMLLYRSDDPLERLNLPDTLKAQFTAFLSVGRVLYSDLGHVLASVVEDTCGWHDCLSGHGTAAHVRARFGARDYQSARNDDFRNARDNLLIELQKYGLGFADLVMNVNLFTKITVDAAGRMQWAANASRPGALIELRAEMDLLVVASNTVHPLHPAAVYAPPPVELSVHTGAPPAADDRCRLSRPENQRGFQLTEALFL